MRETKTKAKANGKANGKAETPKHEVKCIESLKVHFSEQDLNTKGKELARENARKAEIDLQKKSVTKQFTEQIAACDTKISTLSRQISNGYEFREVECVARFHDPDTNQKTIYRLDTNEAVRTLAMTFSERQELLPFKPDTNKPADEKKKADTKTDTKAETKGSAKAKASAELDNMQRKSADPNEQGTEAPF